MCKLNNILEYEKLGTFLGKIDQVSLIFCEIEECRVEKNWAHFSARIQSKLTAFCPISYLMTKGQLISKGLFGVIISTKKPTNCF